MNIVAGAGDVGSAIVNDERIAGVAFTGSVETGKSVAAACAQRVARMNLEMGGKDPFIVCADVAADVEVAAQGRRLGGLPERRARCAPRRSASTWRARSTTTSCPPSWTTRNSLRVGDPLDASTDVGPMVSAPQRAKVEAQLEAAVSAGATLVVGGDHAGQERGHFLSPAVVTGAPDTTELLREETFGPVAPIVPVDSLDEAIRLANSTRFGLGANVYTRDLETAVRCMREIRAGTVWINDPLTDNDAGPFGGMKQSGFGRELGQEGLEAFQDTKHVHIETKIAPKEWWYPYGPDGRPRRQARRPGERKRERGVLPELEVAAAAQLHLQIGEHAQCSLERGHVGLLRPRDHLLAGPRWALQSGRDLGVRHARPEQRGGLMDLAEPAHDRPYELAGTLAVLVELLGQRERSAQVAGHERVGEVVGARRGVRGGQLLHVGGRSRSWTDAGRARSSRAPARGAAGSSPPGATSSFAASWSSCRPSSRACPTHHFGSSHGLGAAYSRTSPPAFSIAFASCFWCLPRAMRTRTVSGGSSVSAFSSGASSAAFQAQTSSTSR